jgi:Restriction endonuclease PvuII
LSRSRRPQDDDREEALRNLFSLQPGDENRIGTDAVDEERHQYELKTTTRDRVSTARDVGPAHIDKWRNRTWIFGRGAYLGNTFVFDQTYVLMPSAMEPWFSKLASKVTQDAPLVARVLAVMDTTGFSTNECGRIRYIFRRGTTLNNPTLPWSYVERNGRQILRDHPAELRRVVRGNKS